VLSLVEVLLTRVVTPAKVVVAVATEITGVVVPADTAIGAVPDTLVTVPPGLAIQVNPDVQAAQALKIWPSVPTARAVGVFGAVAVTIAPLAVSVEHGIAAAAAAALVQHSPFEAAEQATRI
jgi:hypothetical protein